MSVLYSVHSVIRGSGRQESGMASRQRGFTLIELCATLVVLVILSALCAVGMSSTIGNNRTYAAQDELAAYVAYARSEASRRGVNVLVNATAPTSGNAFGGGWSVCVDSNSVGACDADASATLRQHEALPANSIVVDGTAAVIEFNPEGFLTPAAAISVWACATDPTLAGFDLTIQPNGLTDVADVAANTAPCSAS